MSYQNGLIDNWYQFSQQNLGAISGNVEYGSGSVIFINPAKDLSLFENNNTSNCGAGKYTMTFNINYSNPTNLNLTNMKAVVYCINDAILSRDETSYTTSLLTYTDEEIKSAVREADHVEYTDFMESKYDNLLLSGGGFFSKLRKHVKKAWQHRDAILEGAKKAYALGKQAQQAYQAYKGSGEDDLRMYYN